VWLLTSEPAGRRHFIFVLSAVRAMACSFYARQIEEPISVPLVFAHMVKFLLWCVLFLLCWPLALFALVVYPFVWILLLPFRIVGIAVDGVLGLLRAIVLLPARALSGPRVL
jgi:hypothetical protein